MGGNRLLHRLEKHHVVACPECGAAVGEKCLMLDGKPLKSHSHRPRAHAAIEHLSLQVQRPAVRCIGPSIAYIPTSSAEHYALIDSWNADAIEKHLWSLEVREYRRRARSILTPGTLPASMHTLVVGKLEKGSCINFRNRNSLDNRECNLRVAKERRSVRTSLPSRTNKTGFKGVYPTRYGNFSANICVNGRLIYLGMRTTAEAAGALYAEAAVKYNGEFACADFEGKEPPQDAT